MVLIGLRIGITRRDLLSDHLVDLSHLTLVRGEHNEQPVGKNNNEWDGVVETNNTFTTCFLQAERRQLGFAKKRRLTVESSKNVGLTSCLIRKRIVF